MKKKASSLLLGNLTDVLLKNESLCVFPAFGGPSGPLSSGGGCGSSPASGLASQAPLGASFSAQACTAAPGVESESNDLVFPELTPWADPAPPGDHGRLHSGASRASGPHPRSPPRRPRAAAPACGLEPDPASRGAFVSQPGVKVAGGAGVGAGVASGPEAGGRAGSLLRWAPWGWSLVSV